MSFHALRMYSLLAKMFSNRRIRTVFSVFLAELDDLLATHYL